MEDPTTIAMNLTYFATLGVGVVMFLGVFLAFVLTLLLAGLGRLVATGGTALFRRRTPALAAVPQTRDAVKAPDAAKVPKPAKPVRKEPQLAPDWAAAVERADARANARAQAGAAPEVKVSVRELPSPTAPARDIKKVAPLIESATDTNGLLTTPPRAVPKPPALAKSPVLDTGSLATLKRQPGQQGQETARKAS